MSETGILPHGAALLLLDFQNGILPTITNSDRIVERAGKALSIVRRAGGRVVHVHTKFTRTDRAAISPRNKIFSRFSNTDFLAADSSAVGTPMALMPASDDVIIAKTRVNAFHGTNLHERLQEAGINALIFAGVHTSGVVLSTVRCAADLDYSVFILSDVCADPNEEVHEFLMTRIFSAQASVIKLDELQRLL